MNKGTHFNGQPMYGQLISLLDKHEILQFSREKKGELVKSEQAHPLGDGKNPFTGGQK